jgi:hypothetical protein
METNAVMITQPQTPRDGSEEAAMEAIGVTTSTETTSIESLPNNLIYNIYIPYNMLANIPMHLLLGCLSNVSCLLSTHSYFQLTTCEGKSLLYSTN